MNTVDTRGYSCPEPVLMVKRALAEQGAPLTVLVDNQTPLENITRFAAGAGRQVVSRAQGEDWEITIS